MSEDRFYLKFAYKPDVGNMDFIPLPTELDIEGIANYAQVLCVSKEALPISVEDENREPIFDYEMLRDVMEGRFP